MRRPSSSARSPCLVSRLLARGARVGFGDDGRSHVIYEPLAGATTIEVSRQGRVRAPIACQRSSDTLTLATTQQRFERLGLLR